MVTALQHRLASHAIFVWRTSEPLWSAQRRRSVRGEDLRCLFLSDGPLARTCASACARAPSNAAVLFLGVQRRKEKLCRALTDRSALHLGGSRKWRFCFPSPPSWSGGSCARRDGQHSLTFKRGQPAPVSSSRAAGGFDLGVVQRSKPES